MALQERIELSTSPSLKEVGIDKMVAEGMTVEATRPQLSALHPR
jgi:hypothetical protein